MVPGLIDLLIVEPVFGEVNRLLVYSECECVYQNRVLQWQDLLCNYWTEILNVFFSDSVHVCNRQPLRLLGCGNRDFCLKYSNEDRAR